MQFIEDMMNNDEIMCALFKKVDPGLFGEPSAIRDGFFVFIGAHSDQSGSDSEKSVEWLLSLLQPLIRKSVAFYSAQYGGFP